MNEWFKKIISQIKGFWDKTSLVQKIIAGAIVAAAFILIIVMASLSGRSDGVKLLGVPIKDENALFNIQSKLDEENIDYKMSAEGLIIVQDDSVARRARALLFRENLIPGDISPWDVFDTKQWQVTDLERETKLKQAIMENLRQHIISLDDIDKAYVTLELPDKEFFQGLQDPKRASITITPSPGSDFISNPKKINGLVTLVEKAVGIQRNEIAILDSAGNILNNDYSLEMDQKQKRLEELLKLKNIEEVRIQNQIYNALAMTHTEDRISIVNVNVEYDFREKSTTRYEILPTVIKPKDPTSPIDTSIIKEGVRVSDKSISKNWEGEQIIPGGPPGTEDQFPAGYKDRNDLNNKYNEKENVTNYDYGKQNSEIQENPWEIKRVTVGIMVDGKWEEVMKGGNPVLDPDTLSIKRNYIPVSEDEMKKLETVIQSAVGYDKNRGDKVTVTNIAFDRTDEFAAADKKFMTRRNVMYGILISVSIISVILALIIGFRSIIRAKERARRKREEELAKRHAAMREAALREAEQGDHDLTLSGEDRARAELEEDALRLARENPEDVAHLIRTWLVEE
ncbi:MAG: flagellar M-ring protein FliF [Spirochaetales bacterium]|nr:flagellar M-ring protein FliF [Spirochaetales bacterium]